MITKKNLCRIGRKLEGGSPQGKRQRVWGSGQRKNCDPHLVFVSEVALYWRPRAGRTKMFQMTASGRAKEPLLFVNSRC